MRAVHSLALAVLVGVIAMAAPAVAHEQNLGASWLTVEDHPGWYWPSTSSKTTNFEMIGSVSRTRADSTYRNSDLAFWGRMAYAGHYDGFQIVDIGNPRKPEQITDFSCPGSQHDVSTWGGRLLFVSVETPRSGPECDSVPQTPGLRGHAHLRRQQPARPVADQGRADRLRLAHPHAGARTSSATACLLYVASYTASVIPESSYGNKCVRLDENGQRAHNKISVVEVPLDDPAAASVVSEPRFPQNDRGGVPGYHGCHDITVFREIDRAAAACMGEGQIWDIRKPEQPKTIARIHNPNVEFFHSAVFSNDGERVVFGDEAGGGTGPRCRTQDAKTLGALWFYDVKYMDNMDNATVERWRSSWKVPRIQEKLTPTQAQDPNCTMHNFNVLPTKHRDVLVSSAYAAGTTMVDFTNANRPREVGHLDPHGANTWSAYWYDGHIVTNDGGRGVDIIRVKDFATRGTQPEMYSNPQTQEILLED